MEDESDSSEEIESNSYEDFSTVAAASSLDNPNIVRDDVPPVLKHHRVYRYSSNEFYYDAIVKHTVSVPSQHDRDVVPRGIQSLHHSSLADCILYVMFGLNDHFDYIFKQAKSKQSCNTLRILKDSIVTPLRVFGFVGAVKSIALKTSMNRTSCGIAVQDYLFTSCTHFLEKLMQSIGVPSQFKIIKISPRKEIYSQSANTLQIKLADMKLDAASDYSSEFSLRTVTSQQLVEFYSLSKNEKITPPRNLVIEIDRTNKTAYYEASGGNRHEHPIMVQALPKIYLADIIIGCPRYCFACSYPNVPATLECIDCFMLDETYMQLNKCFYCDECYRKAHLGMTHRSNRLYPADTEELQKYTNLKWSLYGEKQLAEKDPVNAAVDGPEQVIRGNYDSNTDDNSVEADLITYPYELYAIVCQSKSHVAYVRTDVKLSDDTILKYSDYQHKINFENSDKEFKLDAAATASVQRQDGMLQIASTEPVTSKQLFKSSEAWLIFDPREEARVDSRGVYYIPQVHTVLHFEDLIKVKLPEERFGQTSGAEGSDNDNVVKGDLLEEEHRHRLTCDSVALFYRPMMEVKQEIGKDAKLKSLETTAASK